MTLAIANQKGGVAKTTTAVHLAAALGRIRTPVSLFSADWHGWAPERADVRAHIRCLPIGDAQALTGPAEGHVVFDLPALSGQALLRLLGALAFDLALVPVQPDYQAAAAAAELVRALGPRARLLLTMHNRHLAHDRQFAEDLRADLGSAVLATVIGHSNLVRVARSLGEDVLLYRPTSRPAEEYRQLAKEVTHLCHASRR